MFTNEARSESDSRQGRRELGVGEKNWFTMPVVLVCKQSSKHGDGTFHCGHALCLPCLTLQGRLVAMGVQIRHSWWRGRRT